VDGESGGICPQTEGKLRYHTQIVARPTTPILRKIFGEQD
jgi:hypothetical protein